jgi:uroporphyrinogen decarboxylase
MNSKERVYRAVALKEGDRVPLHFARTPEIEARLSQHTGLQGVELAKALGDDILPTPYDPWEYYGGTSPLDGATYTTCWGITRVWISQPAGGAYTDVLVYPLAEGSIRDLDAYPWPDLLAHPGLAGVQAFMDAYADEAFIIGPEVSIFESAFNLVGYERFLVDLLLDKPFVTRLLDILVELQVGAMVKLVEMGVDAVWFLDDPSTQRGMLIAPELWRELFRPRYEYLVQRARAANPDVVIAIHNCGDCRAIIPDWIELGMQVLNPVQPKAMDPGKLKRMYGDALCFWGGVDEQWVLPFGTPADVVEEVKLRLRQLAPGGGYILGPAHAIQADTSLENVLAMVHAARDFGCYPLSL